VIIAGLYFLLAEHHWSGQAIYLHKYIAYPNIYLGIALYDAGTGGCRDGLHMDRLSQNQGAESTLAFLLALAEKRALQNTLTSFKEPVSE
jgi:hypothetical protein